MDQTGETKRSQGWLVREDVRIRPYPPVTFDPTLLWLQKPCQNGSIKLQFHNMATQNAPVTFDPTLLWAQKSVPNGSTMFQFHGRATRNAPVTFDPTLLWAQATWPTGKEMAASSSNSTTWPRETHRSHLTLPYFGLKISAKWQYYVPIPRQSHAKRTGHKRPYPTLRSSNIASWQRDGSIKLQFHDRATRNAPVAFDRTLPDGFLPNASL